ncbi:glycoside hydrolase [Hortaea werneckii]|nr:glycoside hydrolase [Hortaea werneckii]KAI6832258.1 glycoside hydrolase [Hortaea werneckii]KAI6894788.1 glycoside hydrolase [Hortaea werneckii]KAI6928852.1 glycoside hydrolase [Hortaea werneckii]KAI6971626.1 glycoside hydrolase [Hortaea werneckii]
MSFKSLFLAATGLAGVLAAPATDLDKRQSQTITESTTGNAGGYYFSNYVQSGSDQLSISSGHYDLSWSSSNQDVVAGIGWQTGSARTIDYDGSINAGGNSLLALYGWTTGPLVEYYVVETYGNYNPGSAGTKLGSFQSDGGTYDVYKTTRTNAPSIQGTATFPQYISVRTEHRTSGTITFQNHIDAWASFGLNLGSYDYQIMATEGYESTGTSSMTIN